MFSSVPLAAQNKCNNKRNVASGSTQDNKLFSLRLTLKLPKHISLYPMQRLSFGVAFSAAFPYSLSSLSPPRSHRGGEYAPLVHVTKGEVTRVMLKFSCSPCGGGRHVQVKREGRGRSFCFKERSTRVSHQQVIKHVLCLNTMWAMWVCVVAKQK